MDSVWGVLKIRNFHGRRMCIVSLSIKTIIERNSGCTYVESLFLRVLYFVYEFAAYSSRGFKFKLQFIQPLPL